MGQHGLLEKPLTGHTAEGRKLRCYRRGGGGASRGANPQPAYIKFQVSNAGSRVARAALERKRCASRRPTAATLDAPLAFVRVTESGDTE